MTQAPTATPGQRAARKAADALRALRARAKALLVGRALLLAAAGVGGFFLVAGVIDYLLRLPEPARWVLLAVGVVGVALVCWRVLWPAITFAPSLTAVALRLRGADPASSPALPAGIDLADADEPDDPLERTLHETALARAAEGFDARRARALLHTGEFARAALLAACLGLLAGIVAVQWPGLARTGLQRIGTPWTDARWPSRYPVVDMSRVAIHPADQHFPLRAALVRTPDRLTAGSVEAHFRIVEGDTLLPRAGPTRRVLLTDQQRSIDLIGEERAGAIGQGRLFERLLEPAALGGEGDADGPLFLEYWLTTPDDRSATRRVRLVQPPALESARVVVAVPAYAAQAGHDAGFVEGATQVGSAPVGPILAGSRVELHVRFNKPLPIPDRPAWLAPLEEASDGPVTIATDGPSLRIAATPIASASLPVQVTDEHGIAPRDPIVIAMEVVADAPPEAVIAEPGADESVLATAALDIAAEGRDDLGVAGVRLMREVARAPAGSAGAPPEPGEPEQLGVLESPEPAPRRLSLAHHLDLAPLSLNPGDEVRLWAEAVDTLGASRREREPVASPVRTLRIIAESELIEQVRAELAGLRRTVQRLDAEQADLENALSEADPTTPERQAALSQRLELQQALVGRLAARQARNALADESLRAMLTDAAGLLDAARAASDDAAAAASRLPQDAAAVEEAARAQAEVRDDLGRLDDLLDRGQDSWLVRRDVERLLAEQRRLRDETAELAARTVGRSLDQLAPDERSALERIAQRQQDAADRAADAIDDMAQRARDVAQADPAQSAAMSSAASRARQQQLAERLGEAAQQVAQNQTGRAGQEQEQALDILEGVLEELDRAERAKDSALRRQLASLVESITSLVARQERDLARLDAGEPAPALAESLIRLNQNTLAVQAEATGEPSQAAVASLLGRAGEAQQAGVVALRQAEPDRGEADRHERASLAALRRALEEAEQLLAEAEQREAGRLRRELRQAYRDALDRQAALAGQTEPLIGRDLSRRDRAEARAISDAQEALREAVAAILAGTEGLSEARVFAFAHRRLDAMMTSAADALGRGAPTPRTGLDQRGSVDLLASLLEALKDPEPPSSPFDSGQQQANAGGGQGQGQGQGEGGPPVPPMAELLLLRAMQEQVMGLTRALDDAHADPAGPEIAEAAMLQRELSDHAAELIQRMQAPPGGPPPGMPPGGEPLQEPR